MMSVLYWLVSFLPGRAAPIGTDRIANVMAAFDEMQAELRQGIEEVEQRIVGNVAEIAALNETNSDLEKIVGQARRTRNFLGVNFVVGAE